MSEYYFAVFCPNEDGGYTVWFPDVPEAMTQGNDLREAMEMAADVLGLSLEEYARARRDAPRASTLEEVQAKALATVQELDITPQGAVAYPLIAAPNCDTTPVKLGISLARNVLAEVDRKAKRNGMTRSGFLAAAALAYPA